ncbi:uncharacterized protein BO80DRAFT_456355 [Aspergillus ibericus CBS 121593]|uniref:Glutathione hydrolase n=1 Tax=Aspergillus ibericus CBS 121593 TaxID=1448316 RepID=A0A395GWB4_9EURO|nr:hypothetical protein BO80DRAFT_456355 [Aspergillus ibericus CBS 121593]RAK99649.1 hypothetical protein BO80DRAFT_456355 [Aspergillus ibericus CBS 121593]
MKGHPDVACAKSEDWTAPIPLPDLPDVVPGPDGDALSTRMLEMRLFHHYVTETYITLCQGRLDANHFQVVIPRIAVAHPFLLDSLLALSALHLAYLETHDNHSWLEIALKYQNRACSAFSRVLAEMSPESCGPAFICSIFIMLCATAYPCVTQDRQTFEPLSHVLEIRQLIAGCAFLFEQLNGMEYRGDLQGWLKYKDDEVDQDGNPYSAIMESMQRVQVKYTSLGGPHQTTYQGTWDILHEAIKRWPFGGPNGGVIAWPINISEDYIALLQSGDWVARVLFLHYGVGLHLLSDKWFVRDWGRRLIETVLQSQEDVPSMWTDTIAWTREANNQPTPIPSHDAEKQPILGPLEIPVARSRLGLSHDKRLARPTMFRLVKLTVLSTFLLTVLVIQLPSVLTSPLDFATRQQVGGDGIEDGKRGAAASESAICSRHGTDIITMGGNAADAVRISHLGRSLMRRCANGKSSDGGHNALRWSCMYHSGIGGGGFMLVKDPNGSFEFIDFRETAPAAAFEDMFNNNTQAATIGGLASGVPGELRGLEYLHNKYGSLPWSAVVQPAIQTARDGWPVGQDLIRYMEAAVGDGEDFLSRDPTWALDFAPNGTRLGLGDTITRKRYAATLETIASQGADAFYSGSIAKTMVNAVQAANGTMTLEDLANYTVAIRNVSQIDYRGYQITSTTAPSSGIVAMNVLKVLGTYDDFFGSDALNLSTHRMDEAIRFGYGLRTNLGDPYFLEDMDKYQAMMLADSTIEGIRQNISDLQTQAVAAYDPEGLESLETPGTSHIATIDHSGLAISAITTINLLFGSQVMVPETGIIMNNEMDDFSIPNSSNSFGYVPSEANFIRPGKRPLSSSTPAIVTHPNGTVFFVAGSAGGSRIITATIQNIIHAVDQGMSAAEALAQPRLHDQLIPNHVTFEYTYDNETVSFMAARGHNVTWVAPGQSTAHAIRVLPNGTFDAAGEPRQVDSGGFAV